ALQQSRAGAQERSTVGSLTRISVTLRLLFSRAGLHPADIPFLPAEAFSPNNPQGACPACQGMGMVHEVKADALVPDGSLSIREGAIASWPNGWQAKNLRSILDSLGYDIDAPWDTLAEKDREWILFTDEQPSVPIFMGLNAEQRREAIAAGTEPAYTGTYTSARKYLLQSYSGGKDSVKKRLSRFITVGPCNECHGKRLNRNALAYTFAGHDIAEMGELTITQLKALLLPFAEGHSSHMPGEAALREAVIRMTTDICGRLDQLERLGLGHLSL
ncbi:excinuclease ABC subunit A, partial [Klebsiella pneumoniae]